MVTLLDPVERGGRPRVTSVAGRDAPSPPLVPGLSRPPPTGVDRGVPIDADRELLAGLRRRDPAAFDAAYERYGRRVMRFLTQLARRRDVAEDLFQETWLKLAATAERLDPDGDLLAWLLTVARNGYLSRRRRDARLALGEDEDATAGDAATPAPDAAAEAGELLAALSRSLGELSAADREVLLLVGVEGLSCDRAAAVLGVGAAALRQRLHRARARLLAGLEPPGRPAAREPER